MADSNITKHALAAALQELMTELPFEKINVAQICERCKMNRKSFYYHFKDKYDLVNWIFDTEFIALINVWKSVMISIGYFWKKHAITSIKITTFIGKHFKSKVRILSATTSGSISVPF